LVSRYQWYLIVVVPRLRRSEQVDRNRDALLAAARRVFLARGYQRATLEQIAEEAGFSKGVVYSQFDSKGDLFLALLERRAAERAAENARVVEGRRGADALRALLRAGEADVRRAHGWATLLVEFRTIAAREPALNRRYAAIHARTIAGLEAVLARANLGAAPTRAMAELILAVGAGTALERCVRGDALPVAQLEPMLMAALGVAGPARRSR
jgi:AcrR family transcriptional regulator